MDLPQEAVGLLSSDEGGGSSDERPDSSEDEVTEHVRASPPRDLPDTMQPAHTQVLQVPTISVTPHSPGVLEDSLQQLRRLHAAVQRMRAAPLPLLNNSGRISTSCPALCKDGAQEVDCSSPTNLDYFPSSRKGSMESRQWALGWDGGDDNRRRSWAALEPVARNLDSRRQRSTLNGHSASLSSMESEGETPRPPRHSTHSLNDNDLAKDFEKVTAALRAVALGGGGVGGEAAGAGSPEVDAPHRLQPRLPLQKSVSTPSIVAAMQPGAPAPTLAPTAILAGGGSDSESDSASAAASGASKPPVRRNNAHQDHLGLRQLAFLEQKSTRRNKTKQTSVQNEHASGSRAAYDHHSEKRRKRGSLFFRKKKDKSRKGAHAWLAANSGGDCDWCSRPIADKPALYCEHCTMTVHQNVCKDYITECNKPKSSKSSVAKSLSAGSSKSNKRSSLASQSQNATSKKTGTGCYSPWRLVATKLGVHTSHLLSEDKDGSDHRHDQSNASDDASSEWLEAYLTAEQLGPEAAALGLGALEPDTWGAGAPKGLARQLGDREQKRQEHIYELILTEKHHCLTIRLMQKMFAEGMMRCASVSAAQIERMFPRLDELWALHSALLGRLRARQRAAVHVDTVADILAHAFTAANNDKFKSAYGEFCSRHRDAVEVFKDCCAREVRLARFIRKCQANPLLRKKGVPECVLFVAQRLTKYPLLLEPLLKTAGDNALERERLQKALAGVKEILVDVDNQVACKEREDRKLEIYHRVDAKSFAVYRGRKFKKSDILHGNRSLKFEGMATLMQGRSKMQTLLVIVLTDVLFFLHDNNNKYTFFTPENKTGVVSLVKLLVREKAGAEGRGLYLICSSPSEPEMFELRVHRPKDIAHWIQAIRAAVQSCPEEADECETGTQTNTAEERQRQLEARQESIRLITEALRSKDREHAAILEEKMALHLKMVSQTGNTTLEVPHTGVNCVFPGGLVFPEYVRLAAPSPDTHALWQEVCKVVKEALEASSVAWGAAGGLGRSTSSAGERHSAAYESPALPRRADTFGGFDNHHKVRKPLLSTAEEGEGVGEVEEAAGAVDAGAAAVRLHHAIYTLTCIVWQQLTTIHSLEAQVCAWRECGGGGAGGGGAAGARPHDAALEELRSAQARLTAERAAFDMQRNHHAITTHHERMQLAVARQQLAEQQRDVEEQRERLYRRLERLHHHDGSQEEIASVGTLSPDSSLSDTNRRKEPKWRSNRASTGSESSARGAVLPPPQLLSAQNETKATVVAPAIAQIVKQQLPLKLASGRSAVAAHASTPPGYHRLHDSPSAENVAQPMPTVSHTRTGSSPAAMPVNQQFNNKATRTNTYPKLPDKFRVRSPEAQAGASGPSQPAHGSQAAASQPAAGPPAKEEEVIYF